MKRIAVCVSVALLLSVTLLACGAAPASVAPVQSNTGTAPPARATDAPAAPTLPDATLSPQPTGTQATPPPTAALGQPFALARGQAVQVAGSDLTLRFTDVTEDSRCPRDVDCVWEGQVSIVLDVSPGSQASSPVTLTLRGTGRQTDGSRVAVGGYTVQVKVVAPYPGEGTDIAPDDYVATLRVE